MAQALEHDTEEQTCQGTTYLLRDGISARASNTKSLSESAFSAMVIVLKIVGKRVGARGLTMTTLRGFSAIAIEIPRRLLKYVLGAF